MQGAPAAPAAPLPPPQAAGDEAALSGRESEVLPLVYKGITFDEVARLLGLSRHMVLTCVRRIYTKLEVGSKTEAMHEARKLGLLRDRGTR